VIDAAVVAFRDSTDTDRDYMHGLFAALRGRDWGASGLERSALEPLLAMQFGAQESGYKTQFPDSQCQVIVYEGRPVGRLWLCRSPREIRILDIGIEPCMQCHGIGSSVLRTLLSEAQAAGLRVTLSVAGDNAAQRLYRRLGFEAIAAHPPYVEMQWHGASASHPPKEICDE
jgi:ribosomal protein S18 acetylase RimI-like enzyme